MAEEVKIQISANLDPKGYDEEERRRKKLKEDEEKGSKPTTPATPPPEPKPPAQPTPKPQPTAPAPRPDPVAPAPATKPVAAPKEDWSGSRLATEANPRTAPRREFRKLTDEERAANRARIEAEDQAAKAQRNAPQIAEKEAARTAKERIASDRALAKERADAEKAITREAKEQAALRKAGVHRFGAVAAVGQSIAQGQSPVDAGMSGLMNLGMRGGPIGMVAATVAAIGVGIGGKLASQSDEREVRGLERERDAANARTRSNRMASVHGSSAALVSSSLDAQEEIEQRKADEARLKKNAEEKWYKPSTWTWGGMFENEGQIELADNEARKAQKHVQMVEDKKRAEKKFMAEEGGLELDALRGRSKRTLAGSREAVTAEMAGGAYAKYKSAIQAGAPEDVAKEMATLTYQNDLRDRQAASGSALVSARSGSGDIAAAARWAGSVNPAESAIAARLDTIINQGTPIVKHDK